MTAGGVGGGARGEARGRRRGGRPFIAVTAPVLPSEIGIPRTTLEQGYFAAVEAAGGLPLVLSHALGAGVAAELFERASGLVLTGGEDVDPARYGEAPAGSRRTSPERDAFEVRLTERALERGMPVLAVCRGVQLLNVVLGGTLHQDLEAGRNAGLDHDRYREFDEPVHGVRVESSERLHGVFPEERFTVNSAHHQGIRDLAPALRANAWAEDGLIEGVELLPQGRWAAGAWVVGVQWHPERRLPGAGGRNRRLFERFGREASAFARRGATDPAGAVVPPARAAAGAEDAGRGGAGGTGTEGRSASTSARAGRGR